MKQIGQNYKSGKIRVEEVQSPLLKAGGVLVRTHFSAVSVGTEGMKAREGKMSYVGMARARPDQVKKVVASIRQQGLLATYEKVMNRLDSVTPLGYSTAGVVAEVGAGVDEFVVGQRVACAGAGYANHAEINFVPSNLVVAIPEDVSLQHASFSTIGSIAMQGVRQAEMQVGEVACVIGLGLIGQILCQILRASGVKVIGIDLAEERCRLAEDCGASVAMRPGDAGLEAFVRRISRGYGADCIFITAGGSSNAPVEMAVELARDRARVVDIGKTKLDLPWNAYYEKELDVRFSRSYGPGRYDKNYEERGIDYPIGYVRWTERRNMMAFLDLLADNRLTLDPLISSISGIDEGERVYEELASGETAALGILFRYDATEELPVSPSSERSANVALLPKTPLSEVALGVIGAGNYASTMLLPHLRGTPRVSLVEVATTTGLSGLNAFRKFNFARSTTDYRTILDAPDINTVLVATQHGQHAPLVVEALRAGKTVFVEKPLAIDFAGLETVRRALSESPNSNLMVGFNRRFSRALVQMKERLRSADGPLALLYRVHAGQLEAGSWYLDHQVQGSRFVGEAGHFFDVFAYLTGSRPVSVSARSLRPPQATSDDAENITTVVQYSDGSVATLLYLTQGGAKVPKEYLEVFRGGKTWILDNFERLEQFEGTGSKTIRLGAIDKGQHAQLEALVEALCKGEAMPISEQDLLDTTLLTLAARDSVSKSRSLDLGEYWEPSGQ